MVGVCGGSLEHLNVLKGERCVLGCSYARASSAAFRRLAWMKVGCRCLLPGWHTRRAAASGWPAPPGRCARAGRSARAAACPGRCQHLHMCDDRAMPQSAVSQFVSNHIIVLHVQPCSLLADALMTVVKIGRCHIMASPSSLPAASAPPTTTQSSAVGGRHRTEAEGDKARSS